MSPPGDPFTLAMWRREVAELYADLRKKAEADPETAWRSFCSARYQLLKTHPQSPLSKVQRDRFSRLAYFPYDPSWRVPGRLQRELNEKTFDLDLPSEGRMRFTRVARVDFRLNSTPGSLHLYWIEGYGGGIFLPFRDATNGNETYDGGRYLYDTLKGADLGIEKDRMVLDFNFSYNPSCAYNDRWVCPLSPSENHLPFPVHAGEKAFRA